MFFNEKKRLVLFIFYDKRTVQVLEQQKWSLAYIIFGKLVRFIPDLTIHRKIRLIFLALALFMAILSAPHQMTAMAKANDILLNAFLVSSQRPTTVWFVLLLFRVSCLFYLDKICIIP